MKSRFADAKTERKLRLESTEDRESKTGIRGLCTTLGRFRID